MKKLSLAIALLFTLVATSQIQLGKKETFAFITYVDPAASIKENGLDFGIDIEYRGKMYAKFGIESFAALDGNYKDVHGGFGIRLTQGQAEQLAGYAGLRVGLAGRNEAANAIAGFEAGIDYVFNNGLLIGLNASYMYRGDMKAMGWDEIWRENGYIRIGYSWDW